MLTLGSCRCVSFGYVIQVVFLSTQNALEIDSMLRVFSYLEELVVVAGAGIYLMLVRHKIELVLDD